MRTYIARRMSDNCQVIVSSRYGREILPLRADLESYAQCFDWGSESAGTTQLALAIIDDAVGWRAAVTHCESFAAKVLANIYATTWERTADWVRQWCHAEKQMSKYGLIFAY